MNRIVSQIILSLCAVSVAIAAEKEVTIVGEAQCAKCSLNKTEKCANAIVAKESGKEVTYFIVENDASKRDLPHAEICASKKTVEAKGTVKEADGKRQLTAKSIVVKK